MGHKLKGIIKNSITIGSKWGRLTIMEDLGMINSQRTVKTECDCGNIKICVFNWLKQNKIKSCGCLAKESLLTRNIKHGQRQHSLYTVWVNMKSRCYNKKNIGYGVYGGCGVIVCEEWRKSFKVFFDWAILNGWEQGLELDKDKLSPYKTGKIYCPEFCCFLTHGENMKYRSNSIIITYIGENKKLEEWCEILKLDFKLIRDRYNKGWSAEKMFNTPLMKPTLIEFKNKKKTLRQWCLFLELDYAATYARITKLGWSYEKALSTPVQAAKLIFYNNKYKTLNEWAELFGIDYKTIYARVKYYGWSYDKAFNTPINKVA